MNKKLNYLDLFAGAGGLSEGFIRAGFNPIAHVEMDRAACFTLRTRMAYHWLKAHGKAGCYAKYLNGYISRAQLYEQVPNALIKSVINAEITKATLPSIFLQINSLLGDQKLDLIIGGPPCQAYSVVGRSCSPNRMKRDGRNYLYLFYAEFLKEYKPKYFVFENVTGLLSAKDEEGNSYLDLMRRLFSKYGYETECKTLSAEHYGVPQNRKRIILVGKKGKSTSFYPELVKQESSILVREIFSDLPVLAAGEGDAGPCNLGPYNGTWLRKAGIRNDTFPVTWHQARHQSEQNLEIFRIAVDLWNNARIRLMYNELPARLQTHRNKNSFLNRFRVVAGDLPFSHTIVSHIAMDGYYYIHPDINQNRSLTPREAARLQTFPDDYYFESVSGRPHRTPAFRQIGNAVPVLLAEQLAEKLKGNWL